MSALAIVIACVTFYGALQLWAFEIGLRKSPPEWLDRRVDYYIEMITWVVVPGYWIGRYVRWRRRMKKPRW